MTIGVFDSGIGGEAIAASLRIFFPNARVISVHDAAHMPYGSRTSADITALTDAAIQPLLSLACDVVVIACNTATTHALATLRATYPHQHFVGIEPMIKPAAALTHTNVITVCATPATLASERYHQLKQEFGRGLTILEPDCSNWAHMIENNRINKNVIREQITDSLHQGSDVIVLGCTHYHWIKDLVERYADGKAIVLEPSLAIARQVERLLTKDG